MVPVRPATISTRDTGVFSSPSLRKVETNSRWWAAMARLSKRRQRRLAKGPIAVTFIADGLANDRSYVKWLAIDCPL